MTYDGCEGMRHADRLAVSPVREFISIFCAREGWREVLERGLGEKLCWLTVRAPAVKTGSPPPGRGEEGREPERKGGAELCLCSFFLPCPCVILLE